MINDNLLTGGKKIGNTNTSPKSLHTLHTLGLLSSDTKFDPGKLIPIYILLFILYYFEYIFINR